MTDIAGGSPIIDKIVDKAVNQQGENTSFLHHRSAFFT